MSEQVGNTPLPAPDSATTAQSRPRQTSLDHGLLNLPLSKRGNIHAEIDRMKAAKAAEAKARTRKLREAQKAVKQIHRVLVDITWGDPDSALRLAKEFGDIISRREEPAIEVPGVQGTYSPDQTPEQR